MDMNKLLGNLNAIENGTFEGPAKQESNEMKKILESFDAATTECGDMPMQAPAPMAPQDDGQPVSINVNLNAKGKENVEDLMGLIRAATGADAPKAPMPMPMPEPKMGPPSAGDEMIKLKAIMAPEDEDMGEGRYDGPNSSCCDAPIKNYENGMGICSDCGEHASPHEDEEDVDEDCYANEPEEEYKDTQYMTRDLAGGLNKEKNAHPKAADGDNPMALEAKLRAELKSMYESKKKTVETEKQKGVDGKACWKGYKRMGTKKKGGKTVDNCVKA